MYSEKKFTISTFLEIILLLILVGGFSLFIGLKINRGNPIDSYFRPKLLQSNLMRTVFFLSDLGDYQYNITHANSIEIEIYQQEPLLLKSSDYEISKMVSRNLLNKPVAVQLRRVDDQSLSIKDVYRNYLFNKIPGQAKIAIFVQGQSTLARSIVGETYESQGIIIYESRVEELTQFESYQKTLEQSTILHEFGHLMGLEHALDPTCVMADTVEVGTSQEAINQLSTDFCAESFAKIPW